MTSCKQCSVSPFDSLTDFLFENETRSEKSCLSEWACFYTATVKWKIFLTLQQDFIKSPLLQSQTPAKRISKQQLWTSSSKQ